MKPTHLDLFSGIGGFSLAFEQEGFETIGFSEIDPYASAVLRKHWPNVINYGDIRKVPAVKCGVVTGGFPCQPYSVAGHRRGKSDDRALWPEMLSVIEQCEPECVLAENVPGIISMELDRVLSDLENIGYSARSITVPACAVNAEHERERVWIVAYADRERKLQSQGTIQNERRWIGNCSKTIASNSNGSGCSGRVQTSKNGKNETIIQAGNRSCYNASGTISRDYWNHQPVLGRGVHGVSNRMDRIRCLGNAIVPQVAQVFARAIREQLP